MADNPMADNPMAAIMSDLYITYSIWFPDLENNIYALTCVVIDVAAR